MTLTYQVGGGGHLDIDVWLDDPNNARLFEQRHKDTGTYSFTATHSGRYTYCFSNEFSTVSDKTLSFNVHGIIYVADEGEMLPIEREIRDLAAGLQAVKDEHEYMVIRERTHRNSERGEQRRPSRTQVTEISLPPFALQLPSRPTQGSSGGQSSRASCCSVCAPCRSSSSRGN